MGYVVVLALGMSIGGIIGYIFGQEKGAKKIRRRYGAYRHEDKQKRVS